MLLFVFTSLLVNSLYFLSEGSIEFNQTKAILSIESKLANLKSAHELSKVDQSLVRVDVGIMRMDQRQIESDIALIKDELISYKSWLENTTSKAIETGLDIGLIREEVTLIKTSQKRIENMLIVLMEKLIQISDMKKTELTAKPPNCAEAISTYKFSGIYEILIPSYSDQPFNVTCDATTMDGDWTIILQRKDGSENFDRNWSDYKKGFGNLTGEFFLGLDKIHALTNDQPQELLIVLQYIGDNRTYELKYVHYAAFAIGSESQLYNLHTLGKVSGNYKNLLNYFYGMNFSSQDRDNSNCPKKVRGGWWHRDCHDSQLTSSYLNNSFYRAAMMIRPRKIRV